MRLAEAAELNPGLPLTLGPDEPVSFLSMAAVTAETASTSSGEDRLYSQVRSGYTPFVDGDLLVAKITPCFENGKIAQAALRHRVGFGSTEFHVVRPRPARADARYLLHFLRQDRIRREGELRMTGSAGQRRVPEHFLADLDVPLPPLPDQRRIAEVLDRAEALRAKRRAALAQLDTLTQSIFLDMFGDPVANPKRWKCTTLSAVSTSIVDGPFGSNLKLTDYVDSGVPVLQGKNITGDRFEWSDVRFVSNAKAAALARSKVREGDHLMIKIGSIGYSAILNDLRGHDCAIIPANLAAITPRRDLIDDSFLHAFLTSARVAHAFSDMASRTAQPALSLGKIRGFAVPLPPLELQHAFSRRIAAVDACRDRQRSSFAELNSLFASLQHRAFGDNH